MTKSDVIDPLRDLPYARELQAYLIEWAVASNGKMKPSGDFHDINRINRVFVDHTDIMRGLNEIRNIFAVKGYRAPWELEDDLINSKAPQMDAAVLEKARRFSAFEMERDHLTGALRKHNVPLLTSLAAFYARNGGNACAIEIDYLNMEGTNEHFRKLLYAAYPDVMKDEAQKRAWALTDRVAYAVAQKFYADMHEFFPGKKFIPARSGGDELRIVLIDVGADEAQTQLDRIHEGVEMFMARMGMLDFLHAKRREDVNSRGFGAYAAVIDLARTESFESLVAEADSAIRLTQQRYGRNRHTDRALNDTVKHKESIAPDIYSNPLRAQAVLGHIEHMLSREEDAALDLPRPAHTVAIESVAASIFSRHFVTPRELRQVLFQNYLGDLYDQGITLTPGEKKLLSLKVQKFPATDYACGAMMAHDFPVMAAAALRQVENLGTPDQPHLWTMGVSFHNLGGTNDALGHEAANALLNYQAQDIVRNCLHRAGIGDENFYMAHMGGGEFRLVIQPAINYDAALPFPVTKETMEAVERDIQDRLQKLSQREIRPFMAARGLAVGENAPETFAGIVNKKEELRGWNDGLSVSVTSGPYCGPDGENLEPRGGAISEFIRQRLEEKINENRMRWRIAWTAAHTAPQPPGPTAPKPGG